MIQKKSITAFLLVFVCASLVWFGLSELRRSRKVPAPAESGAMGSSVIPAPSPRTSQGPAHGPDKLAPVADQSTRPAHNPKDETASESRPSSMPPIAEAENHKLVVYYFHSTNRCQSCLRIEAYTEAALKKSFGEYLADGRIEWRVLNVDAPENEHFIVDYQLYTKSVVLSERRGVKEVRWKNLEKVWDHLGNQGQFMWYVEDELKAFLGRLS